MFTGLIETTGVIKALSRSGSGGRLEIAPHQPWAEPITVGESIAVNGACLTVKAVTPDGCTFDVLAETFSRTSLGEMRVGGDVNLEKALRFGDRLGGHLVAGHVDGMGRVAGIARAGRDYVLHVSCARELMAGIILKGSVCCDGVSLTVTETRAESFAVTIIPHTWEHTTLRHLKAGSAVNLETDMIGKYVLQYVKHLSPGGDGPSTAEIIRRDLM